MVTVAADTDIKISTCALNAGVLKLKLLILIKFCQKPAKLISYVVQETSRPLDVYLQLHQVDKKLQLDLHLSTLCAVMFDKRLCVISCNILCLIRSMIADLSQRKNKKLGM